MNAILDFLAPWEPAPLVQAATLLALGGFAVGLARGAAPGFWRIAGFLLGVALMYAVTQTRLDYYGQYLFFAHRAQHLVLHHLAPFLIALSAPAPVFAAALPAGVRADLGQRLGWLLRPLRGVYRLLQNPFIAAVLFVGLIAFWLTPEIHFDAMLSRDLYWLMNWSMALDGLLFWWLIFARDPNGATPMLSFGKRLLVLALIVPPQILIGAYIFFSDANLFEVYAVCGRAFPIDPMEDQQLGGIITWIPAAMMSVVGVLVLLALRFGELRREDGQTRTLGEMTE